MVSIVIPLYNKAQSITATIMCIQAQTYQDFEIVVVEGWSTDGSTEIIKDLASKDKRIRVLMQQDRHGVTPARNESIEAAKYDRIAFIDADDYWEPKYLETLVKLMDEFPDAGIWGLHHGEICNGVKVDARKIMQDGFRGYIDNPWILGSPYWTGAVGISKKAFEKIGGFDNRIIYGEDIDLWYRLMLEFPCVFEDTVLSYYRVDAENRACNQVFPLKLHIPYYIDKYAEYRANNVDFRRFFDLQCLYRLFPYTGIKEYKDDLDKVLKQIDFSLQKKSMYLRFKCPYLYKLYVKLRGRDDKTKYEEYKGGSQLC
ncbi:MAG: glycosyltransferase family 2 protein [Paludibacteraceae bacterium]|nr:glycosyltransferase family 2 protein [Paludibacteraceae bacterium]